MFYLLNTPKLYWFKIEVPTQEAKRAGTLEAYGSGESSNYYGDVLLWWLSLFWDHCTRYWLSTGDHRPGREEQTAHTIQKLHDDVGSTGQSRRQLHDHDDCHVLRRQEVHRCTHLTAAIASLMVFHKFTAKNIKQLSIWF